MRSLLTLLVAYILLVLQSTVLELAPVRMAAPSLGLLVVLHVGLSPKWSQRLQPVMGEHEADRPLANLAAKLLQHQRFEIGLVVDDKDGCGHAACPSLESIS